MESIGRKQLVRRLPEITLGLLMLICAVLLLSLTAPISFLSDEWQFIYFRQGFDPGTLLAPYYEHLVLIPNLLYSSSASVFGLDSDRPMQVLATLGFLGLNALLFVYLRRRTGAWAAVIGTSLILFLGAAFEDLLFAFQVNYYGSLGCGLAALIALDRDDRKGDIAAALLLVAGIGFSSMVFPFIAAVVVEWMLNPRDRRRRIFVPGAAILIWILWWLGWGHDADSQAGLSGVTELPGYLWKAIPAVFTSMAGLATGDGTSPDQPHLIWGRLFFLIALGAAGWRIHKLRRVPRDVWITLAAAAAFFVLSGLNTSNFRLPTSSRYQLPGALFILLIAGNLLRGVKIPRNALIVSALLTALAVFGGVKLMEEQASERWHPASQASRIALGALDIAGPAVQPGYQIDFRVNAEEDQLIPIELYRESSARHGSPGMDINEIAGSEAADRAQADSVLIDATGIHLDGLVGPVAGRCRPIRGTEGIFGPLELGPGMHLILNRGRSELAVTLSRFSDPPGLPVGSILPESRVGLDLPRDNSTRPWNAYFSGAGPVSVCPATSQ
ncbi:MAG: hypothetical protein KDB48_02055 [Solirubrobacterales bacterium]|nr:hypothetical protein [Solirubrobacterales bacterium]HMT05374.1 hypothetical protein [Solirubrobacterales bacterium]